ncbi:hypothetical protein D3C87_35470 [compost metagenome]
MNLKLERFLGKKWMIFLLFATLIYLLGTRSDRRYGWTNPESRDATPVVSDGAGYYAFLPHWFIYDENGFEFLKKISARYPKDGFSDNMETQEDGRLYNKYYTGTAQCLTPFFLIGHAQANLSGEPVDGYSWSYQLWMDIGILAYLLLGMVCLFLILRRLKLSYLSVYLSLIGLVMATNLCFYAYHDIPYSHVFSFAIVNTVLLLWLKWVQDRKINALIWFAFFLGLGIIIRPTNILILLVLPFFFESTKAFISNLKFIFQKKHLKILAIAVVLFTIPVWVQLITVNGQTGKWGLNPYSREGFDNWKDPYFWNILFGFRKGMFIYAPFLLLLIPGLLVCFFRARRLFYGILIFIVVVTYVLSAWWCWWYGGSLGMRSMIDFYGILVIPIAFLISYSNRFWKIFLVLFVALSVHVYQVYERQYDANIIHYDYMDYPMWKKVFMREEARLCWVYYADIDTLPESATPVGLPGSFLFEGNRMKPGVIYGRKYPIFPDKIRFHQKIESKGASGFLGTRITMDINLLLKNENPVLSAEFFKNGVSLKKKEVLVGGIPLNALNWEKIKIDIDPGLKWQDADSITCFFYTGKDMVELKNMRMQLFEFK